jgi:hypothetical protein
MNKALILFHEKILDAISEKIKRLQLIGNPQGYGSYCNDAGYRSPISRNRKPRVSPAVASGKSMHPAMNVDR